MADRDDPTYRGAAGSVPAQGEPATAPDSDPLAELARIVSGGSGDVATTRRLSGSERLTARASEHNLARDLEAELLENLQASFDAIRAPLDGGLPAYGSAADEAAEPEDRLSAVNAAWDDDDTGYAVPLSPDEANSVRYEETPDDEDDQTSTAAIYEQPAHEPYATESRAGWDNRSAAAADDEAWEQPARAAWSDQSDEAGASTGLGYADDDQLGEPEPLFPSAASFADDDPETAEPLEEAPVERRRFDEDDDPFMPSAPAGLRDRWGLPPLPPEGTAVNVDEYEPEDPFADVRPTAYAAQRPIDADWDEQQVERADEPTLRSPRGNVASFTSANLHRHEDQDLDPEPGYAADEASGNDDDNLSDPVDAFDEEDVRHAPEIGPATAYVDGGYRVPPPPGRAEGRSHRGMVTIGAVLGVVLLGGVAAVALLGSPGDSDVLPPVITASNEPFKVEPPQAESADAQAAAKLSYDRIISDDQASGQPLASSSAEPILNVPPPPAPAEGSQEISRIILPEAEPVAGTAPAPEAPPEAAAPAATSSPEDIQPRRVRTVVVKPDGTIISNESDAAGASSATVSGTPAAGTDATVPSMPITVPTPPALPPAAAPTPAPPQVAAAQPIPAAPAPISAPAAVAEVPPPPAVNQPLPRPAPAGGGNTTVAIRQPDAGAPIQLVPNPANPPPVRTVAVPPAAQAPAAPPRPVPGGGFLVQVSSQRSEDAAKSTYRSLQQRFPSLLGGYQPDIQRADLGDRGVYFRVRVGPMASKEQAAAFCDQLRAAGGDCIVAQN